MGVFTRDRKRGSDYKSPTLHLNQSYSGLRFDSPVPKKLKSEAMSISAALERPGLASKNAAYKVQQYPSGYSRITRQVHAPCGNFRFRRSRVSGNVSRREDSDNGDVSRREDSDGFKREVLVDKFEKLKSEALDSFRFVGKGKEMIDVDDYMGKEEENVSEDLSVEEVEIVENGKESWREDEGKMMDIDRTTGERNFQPSCSSVVSEDLPNANLKSESAGKVLDVVPMEQDFGMPHEAVYRKLYVSAGKRNKKLDYLNFQIALNTNSLSTLRLRHTAKKPTKVQYVNRHFQNDFYITYLLALDVIKSLFTGSSSAFCASYRRRTERG